MLDLAALDPAEVLRFDPATDGGWRLHDHDPLSGRQEFIRFTEDGKLQVRTVEPMVETLLDANAMAQVDALNRPWGDGARVASIPMNVWQKCLAPAIVQGDDAYVSRWLNNPDHARFRTRAGLV